MRSIDNPMRVASDDPREWLGLGVLLAAQALMIGWAAFASGLTFVNANAFFAIFAPIEAIAVALNVYVHVRMPENKRMIFFMNNFILFLYMAIVTSTYQYSLALSKAYEISGLIENADHALGFYWVDFSQKVASVPYLIDVLAFCYKNWIREFFIALVLLTYFSRFEDVFVLLTTNILGGAATLSVSGVLDAKSREAVSAFALKGVHHATGVSPAYLAKLENLRQGLDHSMDFSGMMGLVAFPSFHAGTAILIAVATRNLRFLWLPFLVFNVLVVVGTLTEGGHNLMDVLFGLAFAVGAVALARAYRRLEVGAWLMARFARRPASVLG